MTYPTRVGKKPQPHHVAQDERLQGLLGDRGKPDLGLKALTRADVAALGVTIIKAVHVAAAPTQAEHNALVDDIKALAALMNKMGARFEGL